MSTIPKKPNAPVSPVPLKPIILYDHLPGVLAGYPAVLFLVLGIASLKFIDANPHMLFWVAMSVMIVWYIAFVFNLPKSKFFLIFGLLGTFVGIPVVLEITGYIKPFTRLADFLAMFAPSANAGAYFVLSLVFFFIWLSNFIWSRTHLKVRIDESGLTITRLGGKGERFELIGLKTETEPLDYLELFIAGIGSLSLKTRMNKPIFSMKRVVGLYRTPLFPFFRGKLSRIEDILSYQGKVISVDQQDAVDAAELADSAAANEEEDEVAAGGDGMDSAPPDEPKGSDKDFV
jgi:hypothetical protein